MSTTKPLFRHWGRNWLWQMALLTAWSFGVSTAQVGARLHNNSLANNAKSNQSRIWFHDGKWWTIATYKPSNTDYIWRYNAAGDSWIRTVTPLDSGKVNRYDVSLDAQTGELAVLRSHTTDTKFYRFTYSAGVWTVALAKSLSNFGNTDNGNPCTLVKAENGDYWIFRIKGNTLQTRQSSNSGATWSGSINVKTGLHTARGSTAAVRFAQGASASYVGVAYGELGTAGVNTEYGFLHHLDGAPVDAWTDESQMLAPQGKERGNNQLSLVADPQNQLYLFTRSFGGGGNDPRNALYKRSSTGVWKRIAVNPVNGANWSSPAVAIDTSNGLLIVAGIRNDSGFVEYKCAPLGSEPALGIPQRQIFMQQGTDQFQHLSLPHQYINSTDGIMATVGNLTDAHTWYRSIIKSSIPPVLVQGVNLVPKEVNTQSNYTISLTLTDPIAGALAAGFGKIFVKFSPTVSIPLAIAAEQVLINGSPAAMVTTQPASRRLTITPAFDLPGDASIEIAIDSTAGILNAHNSGPDSLRLWTSSQTTLVPSPFFALAAAKTKVSPALVQTVSNSPGVPANYTLRFKLGAHGRMFTGVDSFYVEFTNATTITEGALAGVKVNGANAAAQGDNLAHLVAIALPNGQELANLDSARLFIPALAVQNPVSADEYTLQVSTSVERKKTISLIYQIGQLRGKPIPGTTGDFTRGNQSKSFFYGGKWWLVGQSSSDHGWYLWKYFNSVWTQVLLLNATSKVRPDLLFDAPTNKLYILFPGGTTTELSRLSYAGGNWSLDAGYPKPVNTVREDQMNLVRAKNGSLWVTWIADYALYAQRSNNEGNSWGTVQIIKSPLNVGSGLTDAVAFRLNGSDAIGVGYAENSSNNNAQYGFVYHYDTNAPNNWTDESYKLSLPPGASADDHINMMTYANQVFMIVKTKGSGQTTVKNAIYLRRTNNVWSRYDVLQGDSWTRPVMALDITNQVFYAFGVNEGALQSVEMKRVPMGNYGSLLSAPRDTVLSHESDAFLDITMPPQNLTAAQGLMVVAANKTQNVLWYRLLPLMPLAKTTADMPEEDTADLGPSLAAAPVVEVYPNPFNPTTTVRFRLSAAAPVKLQIFNISGQLVRTLVDSELPPGMHERHWNGRTLHGEAAASGVYIYRLQIGNRLATGRMQLLK